MKLQHFYSLLAQQACRKNGGDELFSLHRTFDSVTQQKSGGPICPQEIRELYKKRGWGNIEIIYVF